MKQTAKRDKTRGSAGVVIAQTNRGDDVTHSLVNEEPFRPHETQREISMKGSRGTSPWFLVCKFLLVTVAH